MERLNWRSPSNPFPRGTGDHVGERQKECQREWRTPGEPGALSQLDKAQMNRQRLNNKHKAYRGIHQVLCVYTTAFSLEF